MKQFILFLFVLLPFCAFAQVNETFDGPELGDDWIGKDRTMFVINAEGRLQLSIEPTASGTASIGKEIRYSSDMQWEFDVYMRHAPSDENKLCVYLYQESEDRYYYVRIGNTKNKELGLKCHGNHDLVTPRTDFEIFPLLLHVKVTLENNEQWNLYYRTDEMSGYRLEGSALYAIEKPVEKGNLVFTFYYTKTRSALFSIDNVRVSDQVTETPLEPDTPDVPEEPEVLPKLSDMEVLSPSNLLFAFDRPVDIEEAVFSISEIGDAYRRSYVNMETRSVVSAFFEEKMQAGRLYTISYSGLKSLSGNKMQGEAFEILLEEEEESDLEPGSDPDPVPDKPDAYPEGAVIINEIMAKPGSGGMVEYIELYNTTSAAISLYEWEYRNVTGKKTKNLPDVDLPAGGYAVLLDREDEWAVPASVVRVPVEKFPALNDKGATLQLWDAAGNKIEEVTYEAATAGRSWERSGSDWYLCTDSRGGTPGAVNSSGKEEKPEEPDIPEEPDDPEEPDLPEEPDIPVSAEPVQPGEIVINELLPDPYAGGSEYIELYNRSDKALSLSTLSLATRKSDGTLSTRYPLVSVLKQVGSHGYALLTKSVEGVVSFYNVANPSALHELVRLPILVNTSATLVLFRTSNETVIDEVSYSSKWHAFSKKNTKGVALERINPDAPASDPANWTSASETAGFGTPGYQNSQYLHSSSGESTGIEPPVWIEETGSYTISYLLDRPGYNCRAFVFNTSGVRVAEIANHELLGVSGEITWNGVANNGSPLPTGVYIFYAEIYHPEGRVKRFKKAFLIR